MEGALPGESKILIIGGGIIGLATAYRLQLTRPGTTVVVAEKEARVGMHQSTHNSGVLHAGLYYKPGSLKARLAVAGIRQMVAFCREQGVAHEICGKLVVATSTDETSRLDELLRRGQANGLRGLRRLCPTEAAEREPNVRCVAAVEVPEEGIVDYRGVCDALASEVLRGGGEIRVDSEVRLLERRDGKWQAETVGGHITADYLINCAGLHVDRIASLAGHRSRVRIVPFRGEYFELRRERRSLIRHLVYPVPDPHFPFLGVHFTRMIGGGVEAGPNAVLALSREGYRWRDIRLRDSVDALAYRGTWHFLARHPRMVAHELLRSASASAFTASLQRLVPDIRRDDLIPGSTGVRAQAMSSDGHLLQDFYIERGEGALHVLNAPSPGATASLAIADHLISELALH